jgi:membrane protein required for colicin V production
MNPIDIAVIVILIVGFIWGFNKGFIYMVFSLLAILLGIFAASKLAPFISQAIFPEKYLQLGNIVLFIIIFTAIYFIIRKISYLFEDMIEFLELEWLDSLLGGIIGFLQFFIIVGVVFTLTKNVGLEHLIPAATEAQIALFVADISQKMIGFIMGNINSLNLKGK